MADELELSIEGRTYRGWETATFFRTIEACAGSFFLEVAELPTWSLAPGQRVQATIDGQPFATGWIDSVKRTLQRSGSRLTIEGRDLTADLVDCSVVAEAGEWRDVALVDLAALLAEPLEVEVLIGPGVNQDERFELVAIYSGETAWECLERCLRMRGLLAFATPTGALLITRPSTAPASSAIVEGENLLNGELGRDNSQRYRTYVVTSQRRGSDLDFGNSVVEPYGSAEDLGARAPRTLIIQAEQGSDEATCQQRARWDATMRAARAMPARAQVAGWRRSGGGLWNVNERVRLKSPSLRVDEELLASSARYRISRDEGRTCDLGLARPDAFLPQPVVPPTVFGEDLDVDPGLNDAGETDFERDTSTGLGID